MDDRARLELAARAQAEEPSEGDDGPSSEVRVLEAAAVRSLHVVTRFRGAEAEGASVTVSDVAGVVLYEGALGSDGAVKIALHGLNEGAVVQVLLETVRWHRQAEVALRRGTTEHAFV